MSEAKQAKRIVIDTNIALDWLVFENPAVGDLATALGCGRIRLIANDLVLDELRTVLAYPQMKLADARRVELVEHYRAACCAVQMPQNFSRHSLHLPSGFPICRDVDDQHFLALAFHARADALVTRDKALLKLRKRALRFEVRIESLQSLSGL